MLAAGKFFGLVLVTLFLLACFTFTPCSDSWSDSLLLLSEPDTSILLCLGLTSGSGSLAEGSLVSGIHEVGVTGNAVAGGVTCESGNS